jgi:hypothetical protein
MKTLILSIIAAILMVNHSQAQRISEKEVPENIRSAFGKNYGGKKAEWDKEEQGFEASFKEKGKEVSVVFDPSGEVLEIENEIRESELPENIRQILKNDLSGFKIDEVARIVSKGAVFYEAEVEKKEETFELIFDSTKLIKKTVVTEADDKD